MKLNYRILIGANIVGTGCLLRWNKSGSDSVNYPGKRSTSETWIEHVKGQTMSGSKLTDDFWANDILWQLSVFACNISVMIRHKKDKYKKQGHRNFIDWFIAVPAKITRSGLQIELNLYEHRFYKDAWEELDRLIEAA